MAQQPDVSIPPLSRKPRKNPVFWIIGSALVLALIGVMIVPGIYLEERLRGRHAWRKYEAEAKSRGVKLDFAEFIPAKAPDAENFASVPVFEAVSRASDAGEEIPNPFKLRTLPTGPLPPFSDPVKQVPLNLVDWQIYFLEIKLLSNVSENAASDVSKALESFSAPLSQIDEAAKRPHCRFAVHWEKGPAADLSHFGLLNDVSKLYALRLTAQLALGNSAGAVEDFQRGIRPALAARAEPALIPGLVRLASVTTMENAVWGGLAAHQWRDSDLQQIESELRKLDWLSDYNFAMSSERGASNATIDSVLNDPRMIPGLIKSEKGSESSDSKWVFTFYPAGWLYQSKVRTNRFFDELLARTDPHQHRWFGERAIPSSPSNMKDLGEKLRYLIFAISAPVFEAVEKRYIQAATLTDETRIACAIERYRLAVGNVPASLDELAPTYLPQVPVQIVNGEPYRYRRTDDGSFVLYSVGMDLRDDGGVIDPALSGISSRTGSGGIRRRKGRRRVIDLPRKTYGAWYSGMPVPLPRHPPMKSLRHSLKCLALTLATLAITAFVHAEDNVHDLQIGEAAPDFSLPGIDGKTHTLAEYKDAKLLMVAFMSNHCPSSHAIEGRLKQLLGEAKGKGLVFVAINPNNPNGLSLDELGYSKYNDSFDDMKKYAADQHFDFPYLYDGETQAVAHAYGCLATPHIFLFDAEHKLRYKGRFDDSEYEDASTVKSPDARNAVEALLAGKEVPVATTKPHGCSTKWNSKGTGIAQKMEKWDHTPVDVENIDVAGIDALRKNGSGRYRLFNVWATWCVPCVQEFPELVTTARKFDMRNFEFITISADKPEDSARVKAFLEKRGAGISDRSRKAVKAEGRTTNSYLFNGSTPEDMMKVLDPEWPGAIPHTVLVGPNGDILWRHNGAVDGEELRAKVLEAMGPYYIPGTR